MHIDIYKNILLASASPTSTSMSYVTLLGPARSVAVVPLLAPTSY